MQSIIHFKSIQGDGTAFYSNVKNFSKLVEKKISEINFRRTLFSIFDLFVLSTKVFSMCYSIVKIVSVTS